MFNIIIMMLSFTKDNFLVKLRKYTHKEIGLLLLLRIKWSVVITN